MSPFEPGEGSASANGLSMEAWGIEGVSLGVSLGGASTAQHFRRLRNWVDLAEELKLHSIWLPEMHFSPGVSASPLTVLAALASRTRTLRLGTTSLLLPIHHPLHIAQEIASLDHLSGGRVIIGLGRGFRAPLFAAFGLDPATKRDRFDQALEVMLAAWSGQSPSLAGTPFEEVLATDRPEPNRPLQRPHPPLAVVAFGRKGLQQAARHGLPYLASPLEPFALIRENLEFHREHLGGASPASPAPVPIMRTVFISDDPRTLRSAMEALEAENPPPKPGIKLPPALARAMSVPLEDRVILGDAAEVAARLKTYREELGLNLLVVRPEIGGVERAALEQSLRRLSQEVLPAVSG